ncbi:uncharacterized protein LOC126163747 [Schistocerca cancellata]|uniref:uncharacterized protein LOC126163747 n=1 Tax=Schistocerca cancellata TaxID=274614 RepID=UPI0021179B62|nr:uncharacterized protein LOC126163747 [Schistocerca cancellata]
MKNLNVCQFNIEGYTRTKGEILEKILTRERVSVVLLQETHLTDETINRLKIPGFIAVSYTGHDKHGIATLVKNELLRNLDTKVVPAEHAIGIKLGEMTLYNVYKPPSQKWPTGILPKANHPAVYAGGFNSQHTRWGYPRSTAEGTGLSDWADNRDLHLLFDPKDTATFKSKAWGTTSTPDLTFVTRGATGTPMRAIRRVLEAFPRSQHNPVIVEIGLSIPVIKSPPIPRWNLRKADWNKYRSYVEKTINRIPPTPENYKRFVNLVQKAALNAIPRG